MFLKNQLLVFDEIPLAQVMPWDVELIYLGYILIYTPICSQRHYSVEDKILGSMFDFDLMPEFLVP